ncbi:MAG: hypothetical protein QW299_09200 [Candidatus Caldarchaeum sp.]
MTSLGSGYPQHSKPITEGELLMTTTTTDPIRSSEDAVVSTETLTSPIPSPDVILQRISSEFCLTYVTVHFWDGKFQVPPECGLVEISNEIKDMVSQPVWAFLRTCQHYKEARRQEGCIRQLVAASGYRFRDGVYAIPSKRFDGFIRKLRDLEQKFLQACSALATEWLEKLPEIRDRLESAIPNAVIFHKTIRALPSTREQFLKRFSVEYGIFVQPGSTGSGVFGSLSDRLENLISVLDRAETALGSVDEKQVSHASLLKLEELSGHLAEARSLAEKALEVSRGGIVRHLQEVSRSEDMMQEVLNLTSRHYMNILQQILREPIERLVEGLDRLSLTARNHSCRRTTLENLRQLIEETLGLSRWFSPGLREAVLSLRRTLDGSSAQAINSMSDRAVSRLQSTIDEVLRQCETELQEEVSRVRVFRFLEEDSAMEASDVALV